MTGAQVLDSLNQDNSEMGPFDENEEDQEESDFLDAQRSTFKSLNRPRKDEDKFKTETNQYQNHFTS